MPYAALPGKASGHLAVPGPASEQRVVINCPKLGPQQYLGIWIEWPNVNSLTPEGKTAHELAP